MRRIVPVLLLLICALLSLPPSAHATTPRPVPPEAVIRLQEAAMVCKRKFLNFSFDIKFLSVVNLNGDGYDDFVLSSEGFMCDNANTLFNSKTGNTYYVYTTRPDRTLREYKDPVIALGLEINDEKFPQQLDFIMSCGRGPTTVIGHYGITTMQWRNDEMKIVSRNIGCQTKPAETIIHSGKTVTQPASPPVVVPAAPPVTIP